MSNFISYKKDVLKQLTVKEVAGLNAIGAFVNGETVLRAPVDTGNLRSSYSYKVNPADKSVTIGTPVEYAPPVEKGTSKQKAQPHLTPAVENNLSTIKDLAAEVMKRE
ncbi:MAG: hypothetical protein SCK28_01475 [Bacillota bacterium]|nr:hypothetical protein [Bacillota bacterium]